MKLKNIIVLLLLIGTHHIFPEKRELELQTAISMAVENNLELKIKHQDTMFRKLTKDTVWNLFLPSIRVSSTLSHLNQAPSSMILQANTPAVVKGESWGLGFGLATSLSFNAGFVHEIIYARQQYESGLLDEITFKNNLIQNIKKTFYNLLLLEENINLSRKRLDVAQKRFVRSRLNFETAAGSQFEFLTARVAYENLKPALTELENGYKTALSNFCAILGITNEEEIILKGEIEIIPVNEQSTELFLGYLIRQPELKALDKIIEVTETARQKYLLGNYVPELSLSLSFDPAFTGNPFSDNMFTNMENSWIQRQGMFALTLAFNLEGFIPGSPVNIRLAELKNEKDKLKLQREQATRDTRLQIRTFVRNMINAQEKLDSLVLNVELAERAFSLANIGYETGARERLEVEDAEGELNKAKVEVLKEKYNYLTNLTDLESVLYLSTEQVKEILNEK